MGASRIRELGGRRPRERSVPPRSAIVAKAVRRTLTGVLPAALVVSLAVAVLPALPAAAGGTPAAHSQAALLPTPAASSYTDHRPSSCSPPTANQTSDNPTPGEPSSATGTVPWPSLASGVNPETAVQTDHTPVQSPPVRPSNWNSSGTNWKMASSRTTDSKVNLNPQELCGVMGNAADTAWQVTTGSPTTIIAVTDSGIEWCDPSLVDKIYVNPAAVPYPENAAGLTKLQLEAKGQTFTDADPYDLLDSGVFNIAQYAQDPRVAAIAKDYGGLFCATDPSGASHGYTDISPMDLIRTFGTATLPDGSPNPYFYGKQGPAGFTEAISGWNFVNNNNNPFDAVHYDHGTGEASDSTGAANSTAEPGGCPNCMVLPVRVGDSFMAAGNNFAQGVVFAVDSGAAVIQEALGALDTTQSTQQAIDYATVHGVPVIASAADEESQHANLPAGLEHTIVVNSITNPRAFPYSPNSYLYLNGCTNYGANIAVSVESVSCSSEATGRSSGLVGLIETAGRNALAAGTISAYPGEQTVAGQPVALSANEVRQLVTMTASDVNFQTAAPPNGPANNYGVQAFIPTTRYHTQPGFDIYTGYGRIDGAQAVDWVQKGWIPPEAEITGQQWFQIQSPSGLLNVNGVIGTSRACPGQSSSTSPCSWNYEVQVGVGSQPEPDQWVSVASGTGSGIKQGLIAQVPLAEVARLFPPSVQSADFQGGPTTSSGAAQVDKYTYTVRIVVQDQGPIPLVGMARRTEFLHNDPSLLFGGPIQYNSTIAAAPTFAPIGPNGTNVLLVATAGGTVRALQANGQELPGWPVETNVLASATSHLAEPAYASGAVTPPRGEILSGGGGVAVGDLADASAPCLSGPDPNGSCLDVVATDWAGEVYAWNAAGQLLAGFPVHTNPAYSALSVENPQNRVQPGIFAEPVLADLQGNNTLDIVAAAMDHHLYAFQPDGTAAPGFPVLVADTSAIASVDPTTNQISYAASSGFDRGSKLMDGPAVANLTGGSGPPDLVLGSNEQFVQPENANLGAIGSILAASGFGGKVENSRIYAVYPNGNLHASAPGAPTPSGDPSSGAFLPGWPVALTDILPGVLPDVGDGTSNAPAVADLGSSSTPTVGVMADVGPAYLLNPDGSSYLGMTSGKYNVLSLIPPGDTLQSITAIMQVSLPGLGEPAFAPLGGSSGAGVSMVASAVTLGKGLDMALAGQQTPNNNEIDAWSTGTGSFLNGFPSNVNDMQFFSQPIVANVASGGPYVVEGSGLYDLRAVNAEGVSAPGFPKFTGGWVANSAAVGNLGNLATKVLAAGTREGTLLVWSLPTSACTQSGPWPQARHDLWNTNNLNMTGAPQATVAPTVSGLSVSSGPTAGGTNVTITGCGFTGATTVDFGAAPATNVKVVSDTEITATSPPSSPPGEVDVSVTTPTGTSTADSTDGFVYTAAATFVPVTPYRVADTRCSLVPQPVACANEQLPAANAGLEQIPAHSEVTVQVAGTGADTVPYGAEAATLNVTAIGGAAPGYLTVFPAGTSLPLASSVNFRANAATPNLVNVPLSSTGAVTIYNGSSQAADAAVDVEGYLPSDTSGSLFNAVAPARIVDTRCTTAPAPSYCAAEKIPAANASLKPLGAGQSFDVQVTGGNVPADATAVVLNVTAVKPATPGYISVYPAGSTPSETSNLNFGAGQTTVNRVIVPVGTNGTVTFASSGGPAQIVVDVTGYEAATGQTFTPVSPARICDTRPASVSGTNDACTGHTLGAHASLTFPVAGLAGVPSGATAVALNVTVTGTTSGGYLTLSAAGSPAPTTSDLSWSAPGTTVANYTVTALGTGGEITVTNASGSADVVVDIAGYYG